MPRRTPTPSVMTPELSRIATVVVLGSIMAILDTTIVAVALATLGRDFRVSVSTIQWVTTGYLLALAMVIPVTGWAIDRFGHKRVFMLSLTVFLIGSSLCGLAWSANSLIAFRVLQGLGGGMILPVGQSMLARAAGPQRHGAGDECHRRPDRAGPDPRACAGRFDRFQLQLALDLLHQRADRHRHPRAGEPVPQGG